MVILGVDGPVELGNHQDDEADSLYVARTLVGDGLATWRTLAPVGVGDLRRFTGPASFDVLDSLLAITGGEPEWTGALWREWQRHAVVVDTDAGWVFAAHGRDAMLDEAEALIGDRLRRSIGQDLNRLSRAGRILACGALEGLRFTAPAVADSLGVDRDELIDFIDETLTVEDDRPDGLLLEDGWVQVNDETGNRTLAMYRFARKLDWVTEREYGLTDDEKRDLGRRLANALARAYGGESHRIAHSLVRLYSLAAMHERASYYRRMADTRISQGLAVARAKQVLADEEPADRETRRRASTTLIAAATELLNIGPFTDGLAFAEMAHRLAPERRDQAEALYLIGMHGLHIGNVDRARVELRQALKLYRELGDRHGEASTRHQLARVDLEQGAADRARTELREVLKQYRELGYRQGEAVARRQLAIIDLEEGAFARARTELHEVLKLDRELGDRHGEVVTRHQLARIDLNQGQFERARTELREVLKLCRELGDRHGEASTRHDLARIDFEQGEFERARIELEAVLTLFRELGDRHGAATTRQDLAVIDLLQSNQGRIDV